MTYPPYEIPPVTGISFASGAGTLQPLQPGDARLCTEEDAKIIQSYTGGELTNAATDSSLNMRFDGLDPASPYQPWYIKGINATGFVGPAVAVMYAKGKGHPGTWVGIGSNPRWVPTIDAPLPPPPSVSNPGDAAAWAALQGAGQGYLSSDRDVLNDIRRLLVAMAKAQGIS